MKRTVNKKGRNHKIIITVSVLILSAVLTVILMSRERETDCRKWVYFKSLDRKITSVGEAIAAMKSALPDEKRFARYPIPSTEDGYRKIYNLAPFERIMEVKGKAGIYETKGVYDLLLGLSVDKEGNVYRYHDCFNWSFSEK